ncbi:MAG: NAD(P)-dependent oxidoreductase [Sphingobacteriaceae bacterium]|nr:NAD(P)-dependent oxidoreductase [Sphingobacteriaceae bacterium]
MIKAFGQNNFTLNKIPLQTKKIKTILITGINGFLGSHIAETLSDKYQIIGLIRSKSNLHKINSFKEKLILYNVDEIALEIPFLENEIDLIIHTATSYSSDDTISILDSNLIFPLKLLRLALKNKVSVFINTDTFYTLDYGVMQDYVISKKQFLQWAKYYSEKIKIVNLIIGIIFGPNDHNGKFTPSIIKRLLRNENELDLSPGEQKRNFLFIREAAEIYEIIVEKTNEIPYGFNSFNIGTGVSTSIKDYIDLIHKLTNSTTKLNYGKLEYRQNEIMNPDFQINEINSLGWRSTISLEQALRITIEHLKGKEYEHESNN